MAWHDGTGLVGTTHVALLDDLEFLWRLADGAEQAIVEAEMTAHLGAERCERGEGRTGYRNGTKPPQLHTRVGPLELRVPQDREGTFSTEVFARYQRSEQALVVSLMEMYVQGVGGPRGGDPSPGDDRRPGGLTPTATTVEAKVQKL